MRVISFVLIAAAVLPSAFANADTIAYDNPAGVSPLQNFGNNLGLEFNVTTPIRVTELGAFDNGVLANLEGTVGGGIDVGIFNRTTMTLVGPTVHFNSTSDAGTQINGDAFLPVNITLQNGSYAVVAFNDDNANTNGGANTGTVENSGGFINFVGAINGGGSALAYPTNVDGGPTDRYDAATFAFVQAPEPTSTSLLSLGIVGLCICGSRRWKQYRAAAFEG